MINAGSPALFLTVSSYHKHSGKTRTCVNDMFCIVNGKRRSYFVSYITLSSVSQQNCIRIGSCHSERSEESFLNFKKTLFTQSAVGVFFKPSVCQIFEQIFHWIKEKFAGIPPYFKNFCRNPVENLPRRWPRGVWRRPLRDDIEKQVCYNPNLRPFCDGIIISQKIRKNQNLRERHILYREWQTFVI